VKIRVISGNSCLKCAEGALPEIEVPYHFSEINSVKYC